MCEEDQKERIPKGIQLPIQLSSVSTRQSNYFLVDTVTVAAAESGTQIQEFLEELIWDNVFNNPHVKRSLRSLAAEALQEFEAGETEEGGCSVE